MIVSWTQIEHMKQVAFFLALMSWTRPRMERKVV